MLRTYAEVETMRRVTRSLIGACGLSQIASCTPSCLNQMIQSLSPEGALHLHSTRCLMSVANLKSTSEHIRQPSSDPQRYLERLQSGSQATTSYGQTTPIQNLGACREFSTGSEEGSNRGLGSQTKRPQSVLEAKKAYRQSKKQERKKDGKNLIANLETKGLAAFGGDFDDRKMGAKEGQEDNLDTQDALAELKGEMRRKPWSLSHKKFFSNDLDEQDVSHYISVNPFFLPEIFSQDLIEEEELHPRGGCPNFEDEIKSTRSLELLYRQIVRKLTQEVESQKRKQFYLTGPPFSGKSVALALLVHQMRAKGWLVWYIPNANQLTHGGFFYPNLPGQWDTPESARLLMRYLVVSNQGIMDGEELGDGTKLEGLKTKDGRLVVEMIEKALDVQTESKEIVDIFLEVKEAVCNHDRVLIAIDNYQALYRPSEYGEWTTPHKRRMIEPSELRVASAMRFLEQEELKNGVVVCASSRGAQFSPKQKIPTSNKSLFNIPTLSYSEFENVATHYIRQETIQKLSTTEMKKYFYLLGANPKELKVMAGGFDWDADQREYLL